MRRITFTWGVWSFLASTSLATSNIPESPEIPYRKGDLVPVSCLNRTIETGEHITDTHGNLQYIPFEICTETSHPLALKYGIQGQQNCTITLTDPLFHLLEFYIHNDVPLTCRIPSLLSSSAPHHDPLRTQYSTDPVVKGGDGGEGDPTDGGRYVPLVLALAGALQKSHLHVGNSVNVLVHSSPEEGRGGRRSGMRIRGAGGYSIAPSEKNRRIVIGDELLLSFDVRWFDGDTLPLSSTRSEGMALWVWFFGVLVGGGVCWAWMRGLGRMDVKGLRGLPMFGGEKNVLPKYNGYGYVPNGGQNGSGQGNGFGFGSGKRE